MKKTKQRNISCRPAATRFGPLERKPGEMIRMTMDELEALYLADFKALYHEACAENLGVSRPTFAKLLKSGRKKVVEMLLFARGIELTARPHAFMLAFPTDDRVTLAPHFLIARYFAFARIEEGEIAAIRYTENPIRNELEAKGIPALNDDSAAGMAAGRIIPPLLKEAHILAVHALGEGIRRNIEGAGITVETTGLETIDAVVARLSEASA